MKRLWKYFLISLIIGAVLFSLVALGRVSIKTPLEPVAGDAVSPRFESHRIIPLGVSSFFNILTFFVFPAFLFIFGLIYSIKESKQGYYVSVLGSLLISFVFLLMTILLGIVGSQLGLFEGMAGLVFYYLYLIAIGLLVASFVVNSIVYLARRK